MNYFTIVVLLPVFAQAMDVDAIKKYASEKYQELAAKQSFSEQDKKDSISSWFTLSLIPFLQAKQGNNSELMKQSLDDIAGTLDYYSNQKSFLKLNPFIVRDNRVEHSIDLMNESINCGSIVCCIACIKHNSYSANQLQELRKQLGTIKYQAIEGSASSLKNIDPAMTQLLFLIMEKSPSSGHTGGYGDSF